MKPIRGGLTIAQGQRRPSLIVSPLRSTNDMAVKLVAEQQIRVGDPVLVEGASPTPPFEVVFEDDGETGYFYALDTSRRDNPIVDAMQIYNVAAVKNRHLPSTLQIVWSPDD